MSSLLPAQSKGELRLQQINHDVKRQMSEIDRAMRNAEADEFRELIKRREALCREHTAEVVQLARRAKKRRFSRECISWLLDYGYLEQEILEQALELFLKRHVRDPGAEEIAGVLWGIQSPSDQKVLEAIYKRNTDRTARGSACFVLAKKRKDEALLVYSFQSTPEDSKTYEWFESNMTKEALQKLRLTDPKRLEEAAAQGLEQVLKNFKGLAWWDSTLGAYAKRELFDLEHLFPGKMAPEIEDKDIDGVSFKLSEYRGKVVVLDFWGDW